MLVLFALGATGGYSGAAAAAALLAPLAARPRTYTTFLAELRARNRAAPRAAGAALGWGVTLLVGAMTLLESLTPVCAQDALVYHLAIPARYIAEGGFHHVPGSFYASFPQNVDMLFALGLLLGGDVLAQWYHWMLAAAATLAVAALARAVAGSREPSVSPAGLAAALFASIPTAALISAWAYVDLGVVFFALVSLLLFLRFWRRQRGVSLTGLAHRSTLDLALAAFFAGVAAGCKYTAAVQVIFVVVGVVTVGRLERRRIRLVAGQALLAGAVGLFTVAPWLVKNAVLTGNPLNPFAYSLFGGRDWDAARACVLAQSLAEWGGVQSLWDLLRLPWDVTVAGEFFSQERFDGVIGAAFLIGLPLLVFGWRRSGEFRLATAFLALWALSWVVTTHQVRFLLPALAIASALIAAAAVGLRRAWPRRAAAFSLYAAVLANAAIIAVHFGGHNPLPFVLGQESRHSFLARELPGGDYAVFRTIDEKLPAQSRILFGSCGNPGFLCKRPYHSDALFENFTLARYLAASSEPADLLARLRADGFTHLLFRLPYVFDPAGRKSEIPREGQALLGRFLNEHGKLLACASDTVLFEIVPAAPTETTQASGAAP
jgi:hypothetical protein